MKLIGLSGYKRSGKSTAGEILERACPGTLCLGFADKLKIAAARALGCRDDDARLIERMDQLKESGDILVRLGGETSYGVTGREYLQFFGTEAGRQTFGETFWIDLVLPVPVATPWSERANAANLEKMHPGVTLLVITDVRFPNEAQRIKSLGGAMWRVDREEAAAEDNHVSEVPIPEDLIDFVLENNGSVWDLENEVEAAIDHAEQFIWRTSRVDR